MQPTVFIHYNTALLPLYFGVVSLISLLAGWKFNKSGLKKAAYILYVFTFLVTTLACGMGGASIRGAEASPGVNILHLKAHAWTAMIAFLLSVLLAWLSYNAIRAKVSLKSGDRRLVLLSLLFIIMFSVTSFYAYRIR